MSEGGVGVLFGGAGTVFAPRTDVISQASGHGVEVTDPGFRSLAASLGLTPSQLSHDLMRMKQSLRAAMPAPSGSASGSASWQG